jgi:integrase
VRDDRLYALWLLVATTGMRRAELAGLRWGDIDFARARLTPRLPRVVVNYQVHESDAKTASGRRSLALDRRRWRRCVITGDAGPRSARSPRSATATTWCSPGRTDDRCTLT